jgi:HlyD family secretion protein
MPRKRTLSIAAVLLAVVAALIWSFRPRPVPADIVAARVGPVTVSIREQARTRVQDRFEISAPVTGFAPRLEWEVGDAVRAGDPLLTLQAVPASVLDPRSRETAEAEVARNAAALRAAEASFEAAEAAADLAESEYLRLQTLFERGTISTSELDRARSRHQQARAELRSAESNVDVARQGLRYARAALIQGSGNGTDGRSAFEIASPVDARVLEVTHESAGVVQPGQVLMEIGDPASLEVVAEVLTADAVRLEPGLAVELERWGGDQPLFGEIRRIEPSAFTKVSALGVEEQRTNVIIELTSPPGQWKRLGHGFRLEARFILWRDPAVLGVPNGAVFNYGDEYAVFAVIDGRARLRPIVIGRRGELRTAVLEGLEAGQAVIAHPDSEVRNGVRVAPFRPAGD